MNNDPFQTGAAGTNAGLDTPGYSSGYYGTGAANGQTAINIENAINNLSTAAAQKQSVNAYIPDHSMLETSVKDIIWRELQNFFDRHWHQSEYTHDGLYKKEFKLTGVLNAGCNRIKNISAPHSPTDATNKEYVDTFTGMLEYRLQALEQKFEDPSCTIRARIKNFSLLDNS